LLVVGAPDYFAQPSVLTKNAAVPVEGGALVAITEPSVRANRFRGYTSRCPDFRDIRFPRLGQAEAEARTVARRWIDSNPSPAEPRVRVLIGAEASEQRFKREASGWRVLHLSTHGFFFDGQCPAIAFEHRGIGRLVSAQERDRDRQAESPLVLAGLVLAGANRRAEASADMEDGILTAEEIASLDLSSAEWVVLSACDTGLGEIRPGEGVFGLRRAFDVAGVRTLIMTLWPVRDDVAAEWMDALYSARLDEGADTAASVARATKRVVERRREDGLSTHPAIWGAFVASGDWR
jgi:CHAT domain-containing protein